MLYTDSLILAIHHNFLSLKIPYLILIHRNKTILTIQKDVNRTTINPIIRGHRTQRLNSCTCQIGTGSPNWDAADHHTLNNICWYYISNIANLMKMRWKYLSVALSLCSFYNFDKMVMWCDIVDNVNNVNLVDNVNNFWLFQCTSLKQ